MNVYRVATTKLEVNTNKTCAEYEFDRECSDWDGLYLGEVIAQTFYTDYDEATVAYNAIILANAENDGYGHFIYEFKFFEERTGCQNPQDDETLEDVFIEGYMGEKWREWNDYYCPPAPPTDKKLCDIGGLGEYLGLDTVDVLHEDERHKEVLNFLLDYHYGCTSEEQDKEFAGAVAVYDRIKSYEDAYAVACALVWSDDFDLWDMLCEEYTLDVQRCNVCEAGKIYLAHILSDTNDSIEEYIALYD